MLSNLILNNAYRILGLDSGSSQRDILKRYKEVAIRLKIDDCPRYDSDLGLPDGLRTEDSTDGALKRLQNPKSRPAERFFWFDISDTVDEEAFGLLQYGNAASYGQAAKVWKKHSKTKNSVGLAYKKNLAVLYCLCLFDKQDDSILKESVLLWSELVGSDRFWKLFGKKYETSNGSGMHRDALDRLRKSIASDISDVYYDLYVHHGDAKYVRESHDALGVLGKRTEKHLLNPIRQSVSDAIRDMGEAFGESGVPHESSSDFECDRCGKALPCKQGRQFSYKDGSMLCQECYSVAGWKWQKTHGAETVEGSGRAFRKIKKAAEKLELSMEQLQKAGLYDAAQFQAMRDHAAEAIRDASVEVHNQADMLDESLRLLDLAGKISATAGTKERLKSDMKAISTNIAHDEDTLVIDIGSKRRNRLIVRDTFMEYKKSRIYYEDASSILYYMSEGRIMFRLASQTDSIRVGLDEPSWDELVGNVWESAIPPLIANLVRLVFEGKDGMHVGNVRFDRTGYHDSKRPRSDGSVLWEDEVYAPQLKGGKFILYADKNGSPEHFASIPVEEPNAIIIPELVKACYDEFHTRAQKVGRC